MDGAQAWNGLMQLMAEYSWLTQLICLGAFIMLMVMVVALLYSGEVQNSEKGPLSLVSKSNLGDDSFQCIDPIITNNLDWKRAICTFYLSYVDRRQRPRKKKLYRAHFEFKKLDVTPVSHPAGTGIRSSLKCYPSLDRFWPEFLEREALFSPCLRRQGAGGGMKHRRSMRLLKD